MVDPFKQMGSLRNDRDQGFTLIETLVVIVIIAILAGIAISVFLKQREKAWGSQVRSALKGAATAIESHGTGTGGNYGALDGADSTTPGDPAYLILSNNGYKKASTVEITIAAPGTGTAYCITATHSLLDAADEWETAVYNSSDGSPAPSDADNC
jgi:prepilin-type N-terminal cleavage/methylation domain-containing protein